jgi:hypothetical protein
MTALILRITTLENALVLFAGGAGRVTTPAGAACLGLGGEENNVP